MRLRRWRFGSALLDAVDRFTNSRGLEGADPLWRAPFAVELGPAGRMFVSLAKQPDTHGFEFWQYSVEL